MEFCNAGRAEKVNDDGVSRTRRAFDVIFRRFNVTHEYEERKNGKTDGHTYILTDGFAVLCIASRGKKIVFFSCYCCY